MSFLNRVGGVKEWLSEWPVELTNELKFVGSSVQLDDVVALFEANACPDGKHPIGEIRSIYFDTPQLDYWFDKIDGDNLKQKVRLRWYGEDERPAGQEINAFIEVKNRIGSARDKSRLRVKVDGDWIDSISLSAGELTRFLYERSGELPEPIPLNLIPVVCITYKRRRYDCPITGSRLAVDYQIRAERYNESRFAAVCGASLDRIVCEFKNSDKRLPSWAESLYSMGLRLRSFSKFGECMSQLTYG